MLELAALAKNEDGATDGGADWGGHPYLEPDWSSATRKGFMPRSFRSGADRSIFMVGDRGQNPGCL